MNEKELNEKIIKNAIEHTKNKAVLWNVGNLLEERHEFELATGEPTKDIKKAVYRTTRFIEGRIIEMISWIEEKYSEETSEKIKDFLDKKYLADFWDLTEEKETLAEAMKILEGEKININWNKKWKRKTKR